MHGQPFWLELWASSIGRVYLNRGNQKTRKVLQDSSRRNVLILMDVRLKQYQSSVACLTRDGQDSSLQSAEVGTTKHITRLDADRQVPSLNHADLCESAPFDFIL